MAACSFMEDPWTYFSRTLLRRGGHLEQLRLLRYSSYSPLQGGRLYLGQRPIFSTDLVEQGSHHLPNLRASGRQRANDNGQSHPLNVQPGYLRVKVWLGVVENCAVEVLLGTSFIEVFIRMIFLSSSKSCPPGRSSCRSMTSQTRKERPSESPS